MRPMDSNAILTLAPFLLGNNKKHHAVSLQAMPWTSICKATYCRPIFCGPWHTEMAIFFKPFHHETNGLQWPSFSSPSIVRPMDFNAILTLAPFSFGNNRKHRAVSLQAMPWTSICIATYCGSISCGPWHTEMAIFSKRFHHETNGLQCNSDTCTILIHQ